MTQVTDIMQTLKCSPQRLLAMKDYAVVLLNTPILLENAFFLKLWNNAAVRHVVDGGANNFFKFLDRQNDTLKKTVKYPEIASGDFDSITKESMSRLKDEKLSKCKVILTEDQDETDFTKALRVLQGELKSTETIDNVKSVIAICEFSGRVDQMIANLNTLHKNVFLEDPSKDKLNVYLMGSETLTWLLYANHNNVITFEKEVPDFTCGVVPLQGPTRYVSTGLKWNLTTDMVCQFGGMVSTSNKVVSKVLEILPQDNHSVFTVELMADDYMV